MPKKSLIFAAEEIIILMLLIASVVAIIAGRLRMAGGGVLVGEVDAALPEQHLAWPELLRSGSAPMLDVKMPAPTRVTVGGATIFVFEVESYDEF